MYSIAVDVGGTFTDCAVLGAGGGIAAIAKALSTPPDFSRGVIDSLSEAARMLAIDLDRLLADTDVLIHGCTVATNAMIERTGARTGLITTRGHEDAIFIGKVSQKVAGLSEREIIHQSRLTKADPPIVDRRHVQGVPERIDAAGQIVVALDETATRQAVRALKAQGVESLAVSLLWSFLAPQHEQRICAIVADEAADLPVFASSDVAPILGEYERTATTALTAYLGPRVVAYARNLAQTLAARGYRHELMYSHCLGGLTTLGDVESRPLVTLDSGPAGGVLGATFFARHAERPHVICTDMGGTSFDVSVVRDGTPTLDEQPVLDKYTFLVPKIAISTIGAGGGSIVWVDEDGLLRVGPQSAGSTPGPAAYGRGGTRPTVTDVDLLLGYLNPRNFLGGRMALDVAKAEQALRPVADQLGMSVTETAAGAFKIVNAHMADLIRKATIEQGYDPRQFSLFCYGGAGPTHSPFLARELGIGEVYVPAQATVFSALGMLTGGLVHMADATHPAALPLNPADRDKLTTLFNDLQGRLARQFEREGVSADAVEWTWFLYMKYRLQPNAMAVAVPGSLDDQAALAEAFHSHYGAVFGAVSVFRQMPIEILKCRVVGRCASAVPQLKRATNGTRNAATPVGSRPAYFAARGDFVATPVFDGEKMTAGDYTSGPAIIERPGNALVVPPGMRAEVDAFHNVRIEAVS